MVDVEFALGAWADESHVADEHVVELRQLIEVMAAEEASHLCQAVVVLAGGELRPIVLGVQLHAAKLIDIEGKPVAPNALLLVDGRTIILAPHRNVADEEEWGEDNEAEERNEEVGAAFQVASGFGHAVLYIVFFAKQRYRLRIFGGGIGHHSCLFVLVMMITYASAGLLYFLCIYFPLFVLFRFSYQKAFRKIVANC